MIENLKTPEWGVDLQLFLKMFFYIKIKCMYTERSTHYAITWIPDSIVYICRSKPFFNLISRDSQSFTKYWNYSELVPSRNFLDLGGDLLQQWAGLREKHTKPRYEILFCCKQLMVLCEFQVAALPALNSWHVCSLTKCPLYISCPTEIVLRETIFFSIMFLKTLLLGTIEGNSDKVTSSASSSTFWVTKFRVLRQSLHGSATPSVLDTEDWSFRVSDLTCKVSSMSKASEHFCCVVRMGIFLCAWEAV